MPSLTRFVLNAHARLHAAGYARKRCGQRWCRHYCALPKPVSLAALVHRLRHGALVGCGDFAPPGQTFCTAHTEEFARRFGAAR